MTELHIPRTERPERPVPRRGRPIGIAALLLAVVAAILLAAPRIAAAAPTDATAAAPAEPVASAQALADALNAQAPEGSPYAEVSADGTTVTLLAPLTVEGEDALDLAVPEGASLTLDLAANDLHLENGGTGTDGQLLASGAGTVAIEGSGGALVSTTADGSVPALQALAGTAEVDVPLTVETPASGIAAVRANGGSLILGEGANVTGAATDDGCLTGLIAGALTLRGTITCTAAESSWALAVIGGTANLEAGEINAVCSSDYPGVFIAGDGVCTISGTEVYGSVQTDEDGSLTITEGHVDGYVDNYGAGIAVTVNEETGHSASFTVPVAVGYLEGVGAVEFEFNGEVGGTYFRYFASAEDAEADAAKYPTANWAIVSEDAYICWYGFVEDPETATAYYRNFYVSCGYDVTEPFDGPTMMNFVITRPGLPFTFTYLNEEGEVVYQETPQVDPNAVLGAPYFIASLPGSPATADAALDVGDYPFQITAVDDPATVYSTSQLALSRVTLDPNGGTYASDYATVKYLQGGSYGMKEVPVREGYELTGWTSAPTPGMVTHDDESGTWAFQLPQTGAGSFTFTAQWEATAEANVVAVSRLWNPYDGAHLLSTDANEVKVLTEEYGWRDEGEVFSEYGTETPGSVPVTRLYNPNNGDHLYTTGSAEIAALETLGWVNEGVRFYGSPDPAYPVYRLWNSLQTADGGLGSHLWTAEANEYETLPQLPPVGAWKQEGIAWNAVSLPAGPSQPSQS